jgi:regulator of replication initiation timing
MPPVEKKKRIFDELSDDSEALPLMSSPEDDMVRLHEENKALKKENDELKSKLAQYEEDEESDDDDDDDESVCDGSPWSVKYSLLKQYKQENGDCNVSRSGQNASLGIWVKDTRKYYKNKKLAQDRIDKLNKIGFYWGKGFPLPLSWEDGFSELKKYHGTFGHCNIPVDSNPAKMTDLAKWVAEQRKQGKKLQKMMPSGMTLEQFEKLNAPSLSFKWKVPKARRS